MMSSEDDFLPGSEQRTWLEQDLLSVDRSVTPWLMLMLHRPIYSSCGGCNVDTVMPLLQVSCTIVVRLKIGSFFALLSLSNAKTHLKNETNYSFIFLEKNVGKLGATHSKGSS